MTKILLLLALGIAVWWWWRKNFRPPSEGAPPAERPVERMVTCAHCGVHLPENDSLRAGDSFFCSEAHRRAGEAKE